MRCAHSDTFYVVSVQTWNEWGHGLTHLFMVTLQYQFAALLNLHLGSFKSSVHDEFPNYVNLVKKITYIFSLFFC